MWLYVCHISQSACLTSLLKQIQYISLTVSQVCKFSNRCKIGCLSICWRSVFHVYLVCSGKSLSLLKQESVSLLIISLSIWLFTYVLAQWFCLSCQSAFLSCQSSNIAVCPSACQYVKSISLLIGTSVKIGCLSFCRRSVCHDSQSVCLSVSVIGMHQVDPVWSNKICLYHATTKGGEGGGGRQINGASKQKTNSEILRYQISK